jgi:SAM-dependent methyltransferase
MQHRPELERWIVAELPRDTQSILDLGCGVGRTGFLLWEEGIGRERVGLELSPDYAARARGLGVYDRVDEADLSDGLGQFEDGAFDVVLCIDVLPHLEKDAGRRLVQECERVARRRVVMLIPLRKQPRARAAPTESDRSTWTLGDLHQLGYDTKQFGSKYTAGVYGGRRFLLAFYVGTLISQLFPSFAGEVVAAKSVGS